MAQSQSKSKIRARWLSRLRTRLKLQKDARDRFHKAQRALEAARGEDLHPREHLKLAVEEALAKLRIRNKQVEDAEKVVARYSRKSTVKLNPERTRISVNKSSRNGVKPRLIVLHITVSHNRPGMADIDGILEYFDRPATQASSHIVNDSEGHDARCVPDAYKSWTQAAYNPQALSIEQIQYADKPRARWLKDDAKQLDNTAKWIAFWSVAHNIPIVQSTTHGVCQHRDLGRAGGGHSDCGPNYPMDVVLKKARQYAKQIRESR